MKGKSKEEIARITQQMYQSLTAGTGGTPTPQPQQPYGQHNAGQYNVAQPAAPSSPPVPGDDDWLSTPSQAAQQWGQNLTQQWQQQGQQQLQRVWESNAQTARALAEQRDPEAFNRYGPEIDLLIQQIPVDQRTPQIIQQAVSMVRGNHVDDLARERAEQLADQLVEQRLASSGMRSGTAAGPLDNYGGDVLDLSDSSIPAKYRRAFARDEIVDRTGAPDQQVVDEFLRRAYPGMPLQAARAKYGKLLKTIESD